MHFTVLAKTDIGISRNTNQDSILVKHAKCRLGEILLAVICDGMGGLSKGEVASAAAVCEFARWFDNKLPERVENENIDMSAIADEWLQLLRELNSRMLRYGRRENVTMGTTFTGILFAENQYLIAHIGDSRAYRIDGAVCQLTTDHTFVAREVGRGTMTLEEARRDERKNVLLQCVGASSDIEPEIITGNNENAVYILCSDGFAHELTETEMLKKLNPARLSDKKKMASTLEKLIKNIKKRGEEDNISVICIKAD